MRSWMSIRDYYSARYLRAWQLQSVLNEALTSRDSTVDWFSNPRAGPWMVERAVFRRSARNGGGDCCARFHWGGKDRKEHRPRQPAKRAFIQPVDPQGRGLLA